MLPEYSSHFKVPVEEFYKIFNEELANKYTQNRFEKSIELELNKNVISRTDPILIQIVEEMGEDSFGFLSKIEVVDIPDGIEYTIEEYGGKETVAEVHRTW